METSEKQIRVEFERLMFYIELEVLYHYRNTLGQVLLWRCVE